MRGDTVVNPTSMRHRVLAMVDRGVAVRVIATVLGVSIHVVRELARSHDQQATDIRRIVGSSVDPRPISPEFLRSFEDAVSTDGCRYVELDVSDDTTRPCGLPCCHVTLERRGATSEYESPWCVDHHLIVYPELMASGMVRMVICRSETMMVHRDEASGVEGVI